MRDVHLTKALLEATQEGRFPSSCLRQLMERHLLTLCPVCAEQKALADATQHHANKEARKAMEAGEPEPEEAVVAALGHIFQRLETRRTREVEAAERALEELLALPEEERAAALEAPNGPRPRLALAEKLLDRTRQATADGPDAVAHLAELTTITARRSPVQGPTGPRRRAALEGLGLAWLGNAYRLRARFDEAREPLEKAYEVFLAGGVVDERAQSELDRLYGALLRDVIDPEAEAYLARAVDLARVIGDTEAEVRGLVGLGLHLLHSGRYARSLAKFEAASQRAEARTTRAASYSIQHNKLLALAGLGRVEEAYPLYLQMKSDWADFGGPKIKLSQRWLEARLLADLGKVEQAIDVFLTLRESFEELQHPYQGAVVGLEAAGLLLACGRQREAHFIGKDSLRRLLSLPLESPARERLNLLHGALTEGDWEPLLIQEVLDSLPWSHYWYCWFPRKNRREE